MNPVVMEAYHTIASILVESLPYLQHYHGKTVVIKYGGSAMTDAAIRQSVLTDIVLLKAVGINVVVVHGGGSEISEHLNRVGLKTTIIDGMRQTDSATMEIVQMVLAGKINKELVKDVNGVGGKSLGLCGLDGKMIQVQRTEDSRLGLVGVIETINAKLIEDTIALGYIPIIATMGSDSSGQTLNVNADDSASAIAIAMQAYSLMYLSDIPGVLRNKDDAGSLIPDITLSEIARLKSQGLISGGMIPKVETCVKTLQAGVEKAVIIDGRIPHALIIEMFTDSGLGTLFTQEGMGK